MKRPHLYCIVGPTASGKTAAAIAFAKALQTEVISADARQFYAEMQIGTAKPLAAELDGVPHHFLGHISVRDHYNAGDFERDALALLQQLFLTHNAVVLVGGSGLYVKTLLFGIDALPEVEDVVRQTLREELALHGLPPLVEELGRLDPVYFAEVDRTNSARVLRALEVCRQTGLPYSQFLTGQRVERDFDFTILGIDLPRPVLYERIDRRVEMMVEAGLEQEVQSLSHLRDEKALQTIGYREWWPYLDGQTTKAEVIASIQQNTRRYAKRQVTWFRNQLEVKWFGSGEDLVNSMIGPHDQVN